MIRRDLWILLVLILYAVAVWAIGLSIPTGLLIAWMLLVRARMRIWTALIYGGLSLAGEIAEGLDRLLAREGFESVAEAVGTG